MPRSPAAPANERDPLYVDHHASSSVLVAAIRNQAALLALPEAQQFQFLHRLFVAVDAIVAARQVYKLYGGMQGFMLATNVAEPDANHAATLLACARELLQVLKQARLPSGEPLDVVMALASGPTHSGLLGSTSLTYQLVGRSVAVVRELSKTQGRLPFVADRSFLAALPAELAAGLVPAGAVALACCPSEAVEVFTLPVYRGLPLSHATAAGPLPCAPRVPAAEEQWAPQSSGSEPSVASLPLAALAAAHT